MLATPEAEGGRLVFVVHWYPSPDVPVGAKGGVTLAGGFHLGLGRYHLDWMMNDARRGSAHRTGFHEAAPGYDQWDRPLTLGPNKLADAKTDSSADDIQVQRDLTRALRV